MNKTLPVTIRVYGLLVHNNHILLSKENIKGQQYTKFPGGGLEYGEGIVDCLRREFMEEVKIDLYGWEHFYTTEDFFASAFHEDKLQVVSIYYKVWTERPREIDIDDLSSDNLNEHGALQLFWSPLEDLHPDLPIDKIVAKRLQASL